jgi:hypothetical protein
MSKADRRQQRHQQKKKRADAIVTSEVKTLVVVVGLAPGIVEQARGWIERALGKPVRVIPIRASQDDNTPYSNVQISEIIGTVADYAKRKRKAEQQPTPSSIILLYVPGQTQEPMLAAFDFFVFPIPMVALAGFENGKQLRHDATEVKAAIDDALSPGSVSMESFKAVHERVTAVRDAEPLQMPPVNFHFERNRPIREIFIAMRRGNRDWVDGVNELIQKEFGHERIPHLRNEARRWAYRDARGLVFLRADLLAHHGANREVIEDDEEPDEGDEEDVQAELALLRGAFRFGCPLLPGFHHDVQLEKDKLLKHIWFECGRKGRVNSAKVVYANIYPNDIVRAKKLTRAKKLAAL